MFFIYLPTDIEIAPVLVIIKNVAMSVGIRYLSEILISVILDIYLEVGLPDHMVALFLIFLMNIYTIFHTGSIKLHSDEQCIRLLISPHPHRHLLSCVFLMITILVCVR